MVGCYCCCWPCRATWTNYIEMHINFGSIVCYGDLIRGETIVGFDTFHFSGSCAADRLWLASPSSPQLAHTHPARWNTQKLFIIIKHMRYCWFQKNTIGAKPTPAEYQLVCWCLRDISCVNRWQRGWTESFTIETIYFYNFMFFIFDSLSLGYRLIGLNFLSDATTEIVRELCPESSFCQQRTVNNKWSAFKFCLIPSCLDAKSNVNNGFEEMNNVKWNPLWATHVESSERFVILACPFWP